MTKKEVFACFKKKVREKTSHWMKLLHNFTISFKVSTEDLYKDSLDPKVSQDPNKLSPDPKDEEVSSLDHKVEHSLDSEISLDPKDTRGKPKKRQLHFSSEPGSERQHAPPISHKVLKTQTY